MNLTPVRLGLAVVGTAAVLVPGAMTASAAFQSAPQQASVAQSVAQQGGKGGGKGGDSAAIRARAGVTFLTECVEGNQVRQPKTFTLSCADNNQRLEQLSWKRWGHDRAYATGIVRENVSTPMSKGDKWISYKVKVIASNIVEGEASASYNKLTVKVVGKAPKGVQRVEVFDLPGVEPIAKHVHKPGKKGAPINHMKGWSDGHEDQSDDRIDHMKGWSDGHEDQSDDRIDHMKGWSDGHEDQSDDRIDHMKGWDDGHGDQSDDPIHTAKR
ncbi:hypothetical protein BJY21_000495 [Kineosphaera limosa]|uniref:Secreted protein n=1 Tax=Kineosphaera limosa NBRC 100340 TaxID=1184609 RepID=K6WCN9_9MICO|nr:hypothetical protein [Kineosphaera limosa]NYD99310.1 hypothetical protein [Kineosphaera limosa]GAB97040.1 hypothetical protein KILIM_055_00080 [Kineosphaera limosa NBRC 100340]